MYSKTAEIDLDKVGCNRHLLLIDGCDESGDGEAASAAAAAATRYAGRIVGTF